MIMEQYLVNLLQFLAPSDVKEPLFKSHYLELALLIQWSVLATICFQMIVSWLRPPIYIQFATESLFIVFPMIVMFVTPRYSIMIYLIVGLPIMMMAILRQLYLQSDANSLDVEQRGLTDLESDEFRISSPIIESVPMTHLKTSAYKSLIDNFEFDQFTKALDQRFVVKDFKSTEYSEKNLPRELPYLTNIRAQIMLMCVAALYTVDCEIFPRRFFKTRHYGLSLMDLGVGCIVASMGLSSAKRFSRSGSAIAQKSVCSRLCDNFRVSAILLVIGVLRLLLMQSSGLGHDPTEYGVHWNFFFTLSALYIVLGLTFELVPANYVLMTGSLMAFVYQIALSVGGLDGYVMEFGDQNSFIDLNRGGIFSLFGYASLLLMSIGAGRHMYIHRNKVDTLKAWAVMLAVSAGSYLFVMLVMSIRESRRQANMPYILASFIATLWCGCLLLMAEIIQRPPPMPPLISDVISSNQLVTFMVANLQVGFCNVINKRLIGNHRLIYAVSFALMVSNLGLALLLRSFNWRLRL